MRWPPFYFACILPRSLLLVSLHDLHWLVDGQLLPTVMCTQKYRLNITSSICYTHIPYLHSSLFQYSLVFSVSNLFSFVISLYNLFDKSMCKSTIRRTGSGMFMLQCVILFFTGCHWLGVQTAACVLVFVIKGRWSLFMCMCTVTTTACWRPLSWCATVTSNNTTPRHGVILAKSWFWRLAVQRSVVNLLLQMGSVSVFYQWW